MRCAAVQNQKNYAEYAAVASSTVRCFCGAGFALDAKAAKDLTIYNPALVSGNGQRNKRAYWIISTLSQALFSNGRRKTCTKDTVFELILALNNQFGGYKGSQYSPNLVICSYLL